MKKKEYLDRVKNLIINRLKFHSPNLKDGDVDYSILEVVGIDKNYPIFVYKKPLDKLLYKAFLSVKKYIQFNLILTEKPIINEKYIKKMDKTFVLSYEEIGETSR